MKPKTIITGCLLILTTLLSTPSIHAKTKKKDAWKTWLKEVELIITRNERSTAKLLKTVEERKRFKEMFWKARNPNPHDPRNAYKIEFYQRLDYANRRLGGPRSDQGRIYILLGKPFNIERYSGDQRLVDCETWEYRTGGQYGLFPFMNIVFYRPRNMGEYQLYHPGIHTARDLLSPYYADTIRTPIQAYREIKQNSTELAQASLSVLPGEGEPGMNMSLSSSNFAFNKIYTLPERQAEEGYLRSFKTPTGRVEVTHTTRSIRGHAYLTLTRGPEGVTFLNYALLPDTLKFKHAAQTRYTAEINIHITLSGAAGKQVFQNTHTVNLEADPDKKKHMDRQKIVFLNFIPVIDGDFTVTIMFLNKTSQDFFTHKEIISVNKENITAVTGFKLQVAPAGNFMPFAAGNYMTAVDPRFTFNQEDALEGIVQAAETPKIMLVDRAKESHRIMIDTIVKDEGFYRFRYPFNDVKDGNYRLDISAPGKSVISRNLHILPFYIEYPRPLTMARPEPAGRIHNYRFLLAQQYMNTGRTAQAIAYFEKVPRQYWTASALPVIARAYYEKKNYAKVVELLDKADVEKVYATLIMLANASIELRKYERAVTHLEQLRKYGDSVRVNQLLAAAYLSLGRQEKARQHYDKAKELMKK